MKKFDSISIVHATLLVMTAIGIKVHVILISDLLQSAGRDAWISVILTSLLIMIWTFLLLYIHKKTDAQNIFDWIENNIGKIPRYMFSGFFCFYLLFMASGTVRDTLIWTWTTYLPETPQWVGLPIMFILSYYLSNTSLQTIAITNAFVLTLVLIFGFFVGITNFQFKDFTLLKPILEHGYKPVISGMIYPLSGFVELFLLILIQHKIYDRFKLKHMAINVFLLLDLTLGPLIGAITEFGPKEAAAQAYPAFEEWGLVSLGRFFEHLDFLSIYQWLSGNFIRLSLLLFIALETFKIKSKRKRSWILAFFYTLLMVYLLIPFDSTTYFHFERDFFLPFTFWVFFLTSILLGLLVFIISQKQRRKNDVQKKEKNNNC